ncbi:MAG: phosphotransferase [Rhodospirillaceae bacterium]|nr:phosphotransferase [Rhodospirillaceae bacterium]
MFCMIGLRCQLAGISSPCFRRNINPGRRRQIRRAGRPLARRFGGPVFRGPSRLPVLACDAGNERQKDGMAQRPALPDSAEAITVDWMQQAFAAGGAPDLPALRGMAIENIGAGVGLLGEILRCRLSWDGEDPSAPASVIVKLPSSDSKVLRMSRRLRLYKREYDYYRHLGPQTPIRSPALLYGDLDTRSHRFVLVLEDLGPMETGDQLAGATEEQAMRAVCGLARLHGRYWNEVDRPPLSGFYDSLSQKQALVVQIVYMSNLASTLSRFGEFFSDRTRRLAEAYGARVAAHAGEIAAGPRTVIHGDVRMDNMFFGAGGGDDFAIIDWQASGLGCGLYDVAYFLGGGVSALSRGIHAYKKLLWA